MQEIWLPTRHAIMRVPVASIQRMTSEKDYVLVTTSERTYLLRHTLSRMARDLEPSGFVRIHRSTIVAESDIAALRHMGSGAWCVVHRDGTESAIGRTYMAALRRALGVDR